MKKKNEQKKSRVVDETREQEKIKNEKVQVKNMYVVRRAKKYMKNKKQ